MNLNRVGVAAQDYNGPTGHEPLHVPVPQLRSRGKRAMDIESARRLRKSERGQTLVITAVGMVAVLAITVLAIDIVALYVAKDQVQATTDAAALAGAEALAYCASKHGLQWCHWASGFMGASCGRPQSDRGRFSNGDNVVFSPERHKSPYSGHCYADRTSEVLCPDRRRFERLGCGYCRSLQSFIRSESRAADPNTRRETLAHLQLQHLHWWPGLLHVDVRSSERWNVHRPACHPNSDVFFYINGATACAFPFTEHSAVLRS